LVGLAGEGIDERAYPAGNIAPPKAENDRSIGFELKIEFAIAASTQPVVLNRFARVICSHRANDSTVAQVVQLL
jgi:hypothetical protein